MSVGTGCSVPTAAATITECTVEKNVDRDLSHMDDDPDDVPVFYLEEFGFAVLCEDASKGWAQNRSS